jgi:nicotinamidase/pyrazinamidase
MKALLIVDVQNDFLPGGALAVPHGDQVIPVINALQQIFSCVIATKDWHPPDHISFASHHGKKVGEIIEVEGLKQELWPDHCVQGTRGAQFAPSLRTDKIQRIFFKGVDPLIDSYSTFYDNAHLRSTGLWEYLQSLGVNEIYIAGLATEYCVKYSVLDASKLGLKIHVVLDGCRGIDLKAGNTERAIEEMKAAKAQIINSDQLLAQSSRN